MNDILKRLLSLKWRKRRRYRAKKGLFVVFENTGDKNQIDDISMGGLSCYYVDHGAAPHAGAHRLKLLSDSRSGFIQILYQTISDREAGELIFPNQKIKRCGVRFKRMSKTQKKDLKNLIKNNAEAL